MGELIGRSDVVERVAIIPELTLDLGSYSNGASEVSVSVAISNEHPGNIEVFVPAETFKNHDGNLDRDSRYLHELGLLAHLLEKIDSSMFFSGSRLKPKLPSGRNQTEVLIALGNMYQNKILIQRDDTLMKNGDEFLFLLPCLQED